MKKITIALLAVFFIGIANINAQTDEATKTVVAVEEIQAEENVTDAEAVKRCAKTGKICDATCANKKNGTCCKGEKKRKCSKAKKSSCSKSKEGSFNFNKSNNYGGEKASCSKKAKKRCCSKKAKKGSCSKTAAKKCGDDCSKPCCAADEAPAKK